ncbi:MAG TPA: hypothetical protein VIG85_00930 [Comamonas sp.]
MSTSPAFDNQFEPHTFGRYHSHPPPLPTNIQLGQVVDAGQMGEATAKNVQMHAGGLPHDFDQLVRSVGEW